MAQSSDPYGSMGSVVRTDPQPLAQDYLRVQAAPDDAGAQVGRAMQGLGNTTANIGSAIIQDETARAKANAALLKDAEEKAADARASDRIANEWAPEMARKRLAFQTLRGPDKVRGYQSYVDDLNATRQQMLNTAKSDRERLHLSNYLNDRIASETESAGRELDTAMANYQNQALTDQIGTEIQTMAQNVGNPAEMAKAQARMNGLVEMQSINQGLNPQNPDDAAQIEFRQREVQGQAAVAMVGSQLQQGNLNGAVDVYKANLARIPIHQQVAIDATLGTEGIRQNTKNYTDAILAGNPLPQPAGAPAVQVQAAVAQAAQDQGIDPNITLTVARIESAYGQNVGTRGTIGQDKESRGQDIATQSAMLAANIKAAGEKATEVLGRPAEPWESYVVYQQGIGGGPALLRAAKNDPTARAVDVLKSLYKNPQDAFDAINNNGGNATMTSGQFLDAIKQKYEINERFARVEAPDELASAPKPAVPGNIDLFKRPIVHNEDGSISTVRSISFEEDGKEVLIPSVAADGSRILSDDEAIKQYHDTNQFLGKFDTVDEANKYADALHKQQERVYGDKNIGQALMQPHEQRGETVQPAASPVQALKNYDIGYDKAKATIIGWTIPEAQKRDLIAGIDLKRGVVAAAADQYKQNLTDQAQQMMADQSFTSIEQVPAELRTQIQQDLPQVWTQLREAAIKNRGATTDPLVSAGLYARMEDVFTKNDDNQVAVTDGNLGEAARLQEEALRQGELGKISGEDVKAITKTIETQIAAASRNENLGDDDHYVQAWNDFKATGANTAEVMQMFRQYVKGSDALGLDRLPAQHWWTQNSGADKQDIDSRQQLIDDIKAYHANQKFPQLVMLQKTPNAVIGKDGQSMTISAQKPEGKADTHIDADVPLRQYQGKTYRVYPDGSWEEVAR